MACWGAVFVEPDEFCNTFFPTSGNSLRPNSQRDNNPFTDLSKADDLTEAIVRATFVKAVNSNDLALGLKICELDEHPDPSLAVEPNRQEVDPVAFFSNAHGTTHQNFWKLLNAS
ncbi:hypothetical protein LXA43DRAFT_1160287 [Ganoderma leucocontextum]|nr:hypothetical protein LXA43DRAFT_1160287 [Ganoderma leucocontextum]